MATIEEALKGLLVANVGVNAVVAGRVYPVVHPQGASLPAIVYQRISGVRVGQHGAVSGLAHPRFQFTLPGHDVRGGERTGEPGAGGAGSLHRDAVLGACGCDPGRE